MKKKFFLLAGLLLSLDCLAQDVIVKKDGSTILAKVLVVGDDVVEYKKFSNQDGPTYKISTSNLLSINYQSVTRILSPITMRKLMEAMQMKLVASKR